MRISPLVRGQDPEEAEEELALALAVEAGDAEDLAFSEFEVDVVEGPLMGEAFGPERDRAVAAAARRSGNAWSIERPIIILTTSSSSASSMVSSPTASPLRRTVAWSQCSRTSPSRWVMNTSVVFLSLSFESRFLNQSAAPSPRAEVDSSRKSKRGSWRTALAISTIWRSGRVEVLDAPVG